MAREEIYRSDKVTSLQTQIIYNSALLQCGHTIAANDNGSMFRKTFETLIDLDKDLRQQLQPWVDEEEEKRQMTASRRSVDQMVKETIGDLNDPSYRKKFNAAINKVYADLAPPEGKQDEMVQFEEARLKLIELRKKEWGIR